MRVNNIWQGNGPGGRAEGRGQLVVECRQCGRAVIFFELKNDILEFEGGALRKKLDFLFFGCR